MRHSPRMLLFLAIILVGALALSLGTPVGAAAPRFIIASGTLLPKPILLDDWQENLLLMGATVEGDALEPVSKPRRGTNADSGRGHEEPTHQETTGQ